MQNELSNTFPQNFIILCSVYLFWAALYMQQLYHAAGQCVIIRTAKVTHKKVLLNCFFFQIHYYTRKTLVERKGFVTLNQHFLLQEWRQNNSANDTSQNDTSPKLKCQNVKGSTPAPVVAYRAKTANTRGQCCKTFLRP